MSTLKQIRIERGLSQTEVAGRWGRSQSQVARIEASDIDRIRIGTLRQYAEAIGSDLVTILAAIST